jgi:glutaredoxin-like YruB-family protein
MPKRVVIYTTPTCPFCTMAKAYLKSLNIQYEEVNVAENPSAAMELVEKSGQMGVPVIDIDGQIIVGFDREAINRALGLS